MAKKLKKRVMRRIWKKDQAVKRQKHMRVHEEFQTQQDIRKIMLGAIQEFQSDLKYLEDR